MPQDVDGFVAAASGPLGPEYRQQPQYAGADQGCGHAAPERCPGQAFEVLAQAVTSVAMANSLPSWRPPVYACVPQVMLSVFPLLLPLDLVAKAPRILIKRNRERQPL